VPKWGQLSKSKPNCHSKIDSNFKSKRTGILYVPTPNDDDDDNNNNNKVLIKRSAFEFLNIGRYVVRANVTSER